MQQKIKIKERLLGTADPYGPHDAALELKKTLQNIIINLDRSDNLDRKQLKEKFKSFVLKSESLPIKQKFSTLIKKKNTIVDNVASHQPKIVDKKFIKGNNLFVADRLGLLHKDNMLQHHTEENKKIPLIKETFQFKNLNQLPKWRLDFNVPPPPPPFELLNLSKKNKPKSATKTSSNKSRLKKNINLPDKPIKNNEGITKLDADIDTIQQPFVAEKQISHEGIKTDVSSKMLPQNLNESLIKKDLDSLKKTPSKKNSSTFTIIKKKNVSVLTQGGRTHAHKKDNKSIKDTVVLPLETQEKDYSTSDTSSSESNNTSDTQKYLTQHQYIVMKHPKKITVKKKNVVEKDQSKGQKKKNVLKTAVLENNTPPLSCEKTENDTSLKKKNSKTRRNSLTNSLSGKNNLKPRRSVQMKKEDLLHESDNNSLSHSPKSAKILKAMDSHQKSLSSQSLDEVFLTRARQKCYEPSVSLEKKKNNIFLNCLSGISTHFSEEAQQISASDDSLSIKKKNSTSLEEPYKRHTSRNICLTKVKNTENVKNSLLKIQDSTNSEDDFEILKKRHQNAADKPLISFKNNSLSQKLTKSKYAEQQDTEDSLNQKEEGNGKEILYIMNNKIPNESVFLKKNMSFKNLHFYESLIQNYDPNKDLWTLKDAFQIIHGPFSATQLVYWIRRELIQCHSDLRFCREGNKDYLNLKETLPYLTAAQILYDKQRLSCMKSDQSSKDRLPESLEDAEKVCIQYHVDNNGSFLSGLQSEWRKKRDKCFPDTQVVLLPVNSTTSLNVHKDEMVPTAAPNTSDEIVDYLEECPKGFVDWAQANNIDLPKKKYLLAMNSTVLKFASPIFGAVLEKQDKRRFEKKETMIDSEFMYSLVICCINPEAMQLLFRALYQNNSVFDSYEPILVLCAYHEATRFCIDSLQNQLVKYLLSVRNIEVIIILSSITEALQHWNLLSQLALMLCNCAYSVFSNKNYLKLGPVTLRFILGSKLCCLDEIQLLVAVYKWLEKWRNHKSFLTQNFYKTFHLFQTHLKSMTNSHEFNLDFDESLEFTHMNPIELQSLNKIFFYSSLRLCQMSPKELNECRYLIQLDTLLLDAFLRKSLHKEMPRRVLLWNNSHHFILNYKNGLFPVSLSRVQPRNLPYVNMSKFKNSSLKQGDQPHQNIPPYYKSTDQFWVSAFGDFRMVTQACWGIQVLHTKEGSISVGAVSEELSNLLPANIPSSPTGHVLWYFNCFTRQFYTALINVNTGKVTCRLAMTPYLNETRTETVSIGCIIVVYYSVGVRNIQMTVAFHNPQDPIAYYRASFNFLHQIKPVKYDELSHRYILSLAPWNELKDYNDTLGIPDITMDSFN